MLVSRTRRTVTVAVDTSLHQRREREGTPPRPPEVAGGEAGGCSHPARAPRGAQPCGAAARTPEPGPCRARVRAPAAQQFAGDPPISAGGGRLLWGSPESPWLRDPPRGGGCGTASIAPARTVGTGLMRNEFEKPIVKNSF